MSQWEILQMDSKISQILDIQSHDPNHLFGRPFMTPYQIAIEFRERFPQDYEALGSPSVGGKGTGQHNSLTQYIANQLSRRINEDKIMNIEGRWLHRRNLKTLQYLDVEGDIESTNKGSYDLSMFRLRDL